MKKSLLLLIGVLCSTTAIIMNCKNKDNPVAATPSGILSETDTYSVTGNKLAIKSEPYIRTYCHNDNLVQDTSEGYEDTIEYVVSNNRLEFITKGTDTLLSGAIVNDVVMVFTRKGSGSDIKGIWIQTGYEYKVLFGTPTADEIVTLNDNLKTERRELTYLTIELEVTDNNIFVYMTNDFATEFICDWNEDIDGTNQTMMQTDTGWVFIWDPDSTIYNIKVEKINSLSVKLTGNISGEIVTITWNDKKDRTYSSSNPTNLAHTYYRNPTICPNLSRPDWYYSFKVANKKTNYPYKVRARAKIVAKSSLTDFIDKFCHGNSYKIIEEK